jgi:hypothetical protein
MLLDQTDMVAVPIKNRISSSTLKAQALSKNGAVGLEGNYVTNSAQFFIAEMGATSALLKTSKKMADQVRLRDPDHH